MARAAPIVAASDTTAPTTSVPGASPSTGAWPSVASVPIQACSSSVDAPRTIAAGVAAGQPRPRSVSAIAPRAPRPISTTTVADCGARLSSTGRYADAACPDTTTTAAARPRCVTGMPASAGAAIALLTPGTTSKGTPAAARASASSPPRPKTNGSPPFRRTTRRPRRAPRTIRRWIVSCDSLGRPARLPTENFCACGASSSAAGATSAS